MFPVGKDGFSMFPVKEEWFSRSMRVVTVADFYELFGSPFLDCTFIGFIRRAYETRKLSYEISFLYILSFLV